MKCVMLLVLNLTACICLAQKNFKNGHIVTNDGETISGFVNYTENMKSRAIIEFKKNIADNEYRIYTANDLKSFVITGFETYTRYYCRISMDHTDLSNLAKGRDTSYRTDTVFLRSLETGSHVELFMYQDKIKRRFYIKGVSDSIPKELVYQAYLNPNTNATIIVEVNDFRLQLTEYAAQHSTANDLFKNKAASAKYNSDDLRKLIRLINGVSDQRTVKRPGSADRKRWIRLIAGAGISRTSISYSGININNHRFNFPASYSPLLSLGVDLIFKPSIGRMMVRQEFSFSRGSYKGTGASSLQSTYYSHSYYFKQQLFYSSTSLLHNVYNKDDFKLFLAGGVNIYWMAYPENKHYIKTAANQSNESTPMTFAKSVVGGSFRAGATITKKIAASFSYEIPATLTRYTQFKYVSSSQQLRLNYLFAN